MNERTRQLIGHYIAEAKEGYVYGGIQSRGTMTFDILGDTFLKGIYAVSTTLCLFFGFETCPNIVIDLRPGEPTIRCSPQN
jgi:hypothetical protein